MTLSCMIKFVSNSWSVKVAKYGFLKRKFVLSQLYFYYGENRLLLHPVRQIWASVVAQISPKYAKTQNIVLIYHYISE